MIKPKVWKGKAFQKMAEWSFPMLEVCGSNPIKQLFYPNLVEKAMRTEKGKEIFH